MERGVFVKSFNQVNDILFRDNGRGVVVLSPGVERASSSGWGFATAVVDFYHFVGFVVRELHTGMRRSS